MAGLLPICLPREKSWPAISWAKAISPAWAWPSVPSSAGSPEERRPKLRSPETAEQARRFVEICNACRYCEGYCAVFPAIELRRQFTSGDLAYLANLCHDCRGCYYYCQYAPPHEFALNLPNAFADLRLETYERYAWPRPLAALFRRNGLAASVLASLCSAIFVWLANTPSPVTAGSESAGAFYALISEGVMIAITGAAFLFAILAMAIGLFNFWRDTNSPSALDRPSFSAAFTGIFITPFFTDSFSALLPPAPRPYTSISSDGSPRIRSSASPSCLALSAGPPCWLVLPVWRESKSPRTRRPPHGFYCISIIPSWC